MRLFCVIFKHLEILTRFKTKVERFILQPSRSCTYSTSVSLAFLCPLLAWQTQNGFYNTFYGLGTIFNEPLPSNKKKCENELAQIVKLFLHYVNTSVWNKVALSDDTNGNKKIDRILPCSISFPWSSSKVQLLWKQNTTNREFGIS